MTGTGALLDPAEHALLRPAGEIGFRPPMLAAAAGHPFDDPAWTFERKLDGVRALVTRARGAGTRLWSRAARPMERTYPEVVEALDATGPAQFVADGEVVALDGDRTSFARLQHRLQLDDPVRARATGIEVHLYLFDLLVLDGIDLTRLPLRTRRRLLTALVEPADPVRLGGHRDGDGVAAHADACARGWEGLMAKRADSPYRPGRSHDWLKLPCVRGQEFVVGGFTDPAGTRQGFGALLVGHYADGRLRYAGKVGTGYDDRTLGRLRARLGGLERPRSPFADPPRGRGLHWVSPELVVEVGFTEWTPDGLLRHPRYRGLREDKPPEEVVRER